MTLKELVKDTRVRFVYFDALGEDDPHLTYEVIGKDFVFDVPLSDTRGAIFKAEDKALYFMRWIRKAVTP